MTRKGDIFIKKPSEVFDTLLDDFFRSPIYSGKFSSDLSLNMYEDGDNIVVEAKVPGMKAENIEISVEDDVLTIEANASTEKIEEDKKKKYYYKEMSSQSFTRSVTLPTRVEAEKAEASVVDGMLKISIPKSADVKPKKIQIASK